MANSKASAVFFQRSRASTLPDFLVPFHLGADFSRILNWSLLPFRRFLCVLVPVFFPTFDERNDVFHLFRLFCPLTFVILSFSLSLPCGCLIQDFCFVTRSLLSMASMFVFFSLSNLHYSPSQTPIDPKRFTCCVTSLNASISCASRKSSFIILVCSFLYHKVLLHAKRYSRNSRTALHLVPLIPHHGSTQASRNNFRKERKIELLPGHPSPLFPLFMVSWQHDQFSHPKQNVLYTCFTAHVQFTLHVTSLLLQFLRHSIKRCSPFASSHPHFLASFLFD